MDSSMLTTPVSFNLVIQQFPVAFLNQLFFLMQCRPTELKRGLKRILEWNGITAMS